jgi:hypothetical protein
MDIPEELIAELETPAFDLVELSGAPASDSACARRTKISSTS